MTRARQPRFSRISAAIFIGFFATWELLARAGLLSALFFPAPSIVTETIVRLTIDGDLLVHVRATLTRLSLGFVVGGAAGYLVGLVMGRSPRVRRVLDPIVAAIHPVPKISLFPIIMIVLGIGMASRTFVVALSTFFPMVINTMAGVRQIHPIYFQVAKNYGARRAQVYRNIVIPASLPMALAGVRLALNVALSLTLAVELVAAEYGIGTMIWMSWQTLRVEELYAAVFIAALIGIGIRLLVQFLSAKLVRWQADSGR